MPLNPEKLLALQIPDVEHTYGPKDCMLYALGLGLGRDPLNADELAFVYEKNLKVLPTFAVMQGYAAYWLRRPEIGVTWEKVVHGEQGLVLHKPVATEGHVIGRTRILDVVDKGPGKGALIYSQREISDKASGRCSQPCGRPPSAAATAASAGARARQCAKRRRRTLCRRAHPTASWISRRGRKWR